ncbi:hypothetical protein FGB62_262g00 [Gracilaria domingensis]|nr:hypothetical protein FGB62_262g00 [Gracilaria domingensis]
MTFVRPFILSSHTGVPKVSGDAPFLVHARTGDFLSFLNISRKISLSMKKVNPQLCKVIAMTLRASYATSVLHNYRIGKIEEAMASDRFIGWVAKRMNTSTDQLEKVYVHIHPENFELKLLLST